MSSKQPPHRAFRPIPSVLLAAALAACGGGGGGGEGPAGSNNTVIGPTPALADARNGTYTTMAADGFEYQLTLDFDARAYRVVGNGLDHAGAVAANGTAFSFGGTGSTATNFVATSDAVVGVYAFGTHGQLPFVAARTFATTLPATTLTFNMLGRTVDTAAGTADTTIQQGRITAGGQLVTCDDPAIVEIANCPAASTTASTISISNGVISAPVSGGTALYRLATIGSDQVLLRASGSSGGTRRFIVGLPATTAFTAGRFAGGTTEPAWGSVTIGNGSYASTGTSPGGVTITRTGTAVAAGTGTLASLLAISTTNVGSFFSASSTHLGVVVAARGNVAAPGFVAIGVRQ